MKIERIDSFLAGNGYILQIHTDNGISGLGQTAYWGYPEAVEAIVKRFQQYLIGQNPLRIEHHWQYLHRMSPFKGNALSGAISAIDIALWDIKGKHFGVPVWELLGGNCRDKIRLHLLADQPTPEAMRQAAKEAVAEGFTAIKFDPLLDGYQDMTQDQMIKSVCEIVAAAREGGGAELDLIAEVHRKLTPMNSIALAEALTEYNLYFIEDPIQIDSVISQAEMAKRINIPIGNGERLTTIWEFRELLEHGGPQYVRPDVALAGGLSHCKKIAAIAESYHSAVVTHNFLGPLITAASLHLDTCIPNFITQEYSKSDEAPENNVFRTVLKRSGGYLPVPEAPGLGVELDETLLKTATHESRDLTQVPDIRTDGSIAEAG